MPFDGLSTIRNHFFQPSIVPMICCEPRLIGRRRIVGMERQAHARLFGFGHDRASESR
jgi:hypothetical protein